MNLKELRRDKVTELVACRVTKTVKDKLDAICESECVTVSSVVAALIEEFLKGQVSKD